MAARREHWPHIFRNNLTKRTFPSIPLTVGPRILWHRVSGQHRLLVGIMGHGQPKDGPKRWPQT